MSKIVLGTAQFGMNYGINNQRGKIPASEGCRILEEAVRLGIDVIDTAYRYGDAEKTIGLYMKSHAEKIKIISKLPGCRHDEVKDMFQSSLESLNVSFLYGYIVHSFNDYKEDPRIWDEFDKLRHNGEVEKIGFSVYFPEELEIIFKKGLKIDMVQIPYSIFDQRFEPYFQDLRKRGIDVYVRSVFLQGLVFRSPDTLDNYFDTVRDKINRLKALSEKVSISVAALCVNFALLNKSIDKVVVGVDNIENLRQIMAADRYKGRVKENISELKGFREDDEKIILPFNWEMPKQG